MSQLNFDYVLDAAKQLEKAARMVRNCYIKTMSQEEMEQTISIAEVNINAALARIQSFRGDFK
jgi:hypothetical protein